MTDMTQIGENHPNGSRVNLSGNPQIIVDQQNQLEIVVLRSAKNQSPEIMPAQHALKLERFEGGHFLQFNLDLMDQQSEYHITIYVTSTTNEDIIGDVLLTLGNPKCHYTMKNLPNGAKTIATIYNKNNIWRIRMGGEHYPQGLNQFMSVHMN